MGELENDSLEELYQWIDKIPLSRPKKNLGRDFSDGGKLFARLGFNVPDEMIHALVACKPGEMEHLISNLKTRVESEQARRKVAPRAALDQDEGYVAAAARAAQREQHRIAKEAQPRRQNHSHHQSAETWQEGGSINGFALPSLSDPGYSTSKLPTSFWAHAQSDPSPRHISSLPSHLPAIGPPNHTTASLPGIRDSHITNRSWQSFGQDMSLVLEEKEQTILELQETVQLLQLKVRRLEHLLRVKDLRIDDLTQRLQVIVSDKPSAGKKL